MSADNLLRIVPDKDYFVIYMVNASSGYKNERARLKTLEEAIKHANDIQQNEVVEYGLSIKLRED